MASRPHPAAPAALAILAAAISLLAARRTPGPPPVDDLDRRLSLAVVDERGEPLAGVELDVTLTRVDLGFAWVGDLPSSSSASVATDARGQASVALFDHEGRTLLEAATSERAAPAARAYGEPLEVDLRPGEHASARVVMRAPIALEVCVSGADGRPVEGAVVVRSDGRSDGKLRTDARGRAVFSGLSPRASRGFLWVWDSSEHAVRRTTYALYGRSGEVAVRLPRGVGPEGANYEAAVTRALAAAAAEVPPPLADVPAPVTAGAISLEWPPLEPAAVTRPPVADPGLGAEGDVLESVSPPVQAEPEIGLFERGEAAVLVRVRDAEGRELPGAGVLVRSRGGPPPSPEVRWYEGLPMEPRPCGSPAVLHLREGEWDVAAFSTTHGPGKARRLCVRAGERAVLELRAGEPATSWIEGRLEAPGREVARFQVLARHRRFPSEIAFVASVGEDGRFLLGPLAPGEPYEVSLASSTLGDEEGEWLAAAPREVVALASGERRPLALVLPPPATLDVVAPLGDPDPSWVSVCRDGAHQAVRACAVERRPSSGLPPGLGRARLTLQPGRYRLAVGFPGPRPQWNARFEAPLSLEAGAAVTITAAPALGDCSLAIAEVLAPPGDGYTFLRGPGVLFGVCDPQVRLEGLPPGRYRLEREGCIPLELTLSAGEARSLGEVRLRPR